MKTRLVINKTGFSRNSPRIISLLMMAGLFLAFTTTIAYGQDKKEAEIKKCETALATAQANFAKAEKAVAIADSLIQTGTQLVSDGKSETKEVDGEKKALEKEYNTSKKPLDKQSGSKDKETATQAKTDLKALDTKYKADSKALETKAKEAAKKITTGEANIAKGKANKKPAADALKMKQASVDAAQAKLDAAQGNEPVNTDKKKKK